MTGWEVRAILVGIGDKAIELNEEVLSSSRAIFRSGEDQKRATDVKISTFFVSEAGEVEKIPAIYSLRGPIELTREAVDFREKLPPGSYKLEIVPRSDAYMYPSVSADLRIEHDDESIEGRAEVYTKFERGGEGREIGPLISILLLGILGFLLGSYRLFLITPSSLPWVLTKFFLLSTTISSSIYYALKNRYRAFSSTVPSDIDLRVLLGAYLGFVAGMGLALMLDYLAVAFPLGPLSAILYPSGGFAEEVLMLLLGAIGSLLGVLVWLLTRTEREELGKLVITLQDWIAMKRRLILTLLASMFAGSIIGGTLPLIVGREALETGSLTPIAVIPLISLVSGTFVGLLSEYLSRNRRWEISAPLIAAAGTYSLIQALLSYAGVLGVLPEYLTTSVDVLSGMNIASALAGVLAIFAIVKDLKKPRLPTFTYTRKKAEERREEAFRARLVGIALSAREHPLERAQRVRETEDVISTTLGITVPLVLKIDLESDFGKKQIEGSLSMLFDAIITNCGKPPETVILVFDSYREPDLTTYVASGLPEILRSLSDVPVISLIITSSDMLEERVKELQEPLKSIERVSSTVFVVDYENFAHGSLSAEEVNRTFIRRLSTALGTLLEVDEVDGALKLGPKDLNKLLRDPKDDPFGTICLSELDPSRCEEGVTPELVRGLVRGAISRPFAGYSRDKEGSTWAILLLRGPKEDNYLWAAKSELEIRYSGRVVAASDIPAEDPLTAVILISGLQIEDIPVISARGGS